MAAAPDIVLPALESSDWFLCAWCRTPLAANRPRPERSVANFGICPECLRDQLARDRRRSRRISRPGRGGKR